MIDMQQLLANDWPTMMMISTNVLIIDDDSCEPAFSKDEIQVYHAQMLYDNYLPLVVVVTECLLIDQVYHQFARTVVGRC